ncbi:uncharacterized protein LOC115083942 isoform X2 [Rhinatrema bivittatum]|uniref:uncharacterized protein LOC115083942 isoform X2 n=1 Tax=Rhinatrema bivittatum TaxID=194408 RepID=UPI001127ED30|nr:uncharacterized protein LOC115083942 isoform X2 [Rhinatrema bivittatum]XP_029443952.1 uncharacterized protein LOC115083942 isoform X2 [Rhinatrema bivittatum]XP_029443953.1 uncharacterized protein LOC115083942 isoform X2 [Rhinatrema bivittatum]
MGLYLSWEKRRGLQVIRILDNGEVEPMVASDSSSLQQPTISRKAQAPNGRYTTVLKDVGTQTNPVFVYSSYEEMLEDFNARAGHATEEEDGGGSAASNEPDATTFHETKEEEFHAVKIEVVEEEEEEENLTPVTPRPYPYPYPINSLPQAAAPRFPIIKRRRRQRFICDWQGPVTVINSPNVPVDAVELRVDEDLALSIRRQVDVNNPGPFGWQLAKLLYTEEELYGHNFNGTDQKLPLSPRRVHAIQHAFHDYFPKDIADSALSKGRTAINQGIRNMFYVRNKKEGDPTYVGPS